jgi:muramoyltetrapeptide carboxypeptidase
LQGVVVGRFQKGSEMDPTKLQTIIDTKAELANIPVVCHADFGHTNPKFVFPIGGVGEINVDTDPQNCTLTILKH